jgi:RNA polymerase primary sigma factor
MKQHLERSTSDQGSNLPWSMTNLSLYLSEIGTFPILSHEEVQALAVRVQAGDETAKHRLIEGNLRLVVHCAKRYGTGELPLLDHIQNGFFGLLRAIERFDPTKGYHLSTYAVWWIRQAITHATGSSSRLIRLPLYIQHRIRCMEDFSDQWFALHGEEPLVDYLALCLRVSHEHVQLLQACREQTLSLDFVPDLDAERGTPLAERLVDRETPPVCEQAVHEDSTARLHGHLREALVLLTERERQAITMRYGLCGETIESLAQIGQRLGISRERVRQLCASALKKLATAPALQGYRPCETSTDGWDWDGMDDTSSGKLAGEWEEDQLCVV